MPELAPQRTAPSRPQEGKRKSAAGKSAQKRRSPLGAAGVLLRELQAQGVPRLQLHPHPLPV
jgi:hypothetical protein